jgi:hypothetical protein
MPLGLYDPAPGGIIFLMPDGVAFQSNGNFLGFGCRIQAARHSRLQGSRSSSKISAPKLQATSIAIRDF